MSRKGPRNLTPEETALWEKVKQRANPMHPARTQPVTATLLQPTPKKPTPDPIAHFQIGEKATDTMLPRRHAPATQTIQMDRKGFTQLKRGKLKPEARIDLHGMTLADAHPELNRFILTSHAKARRLVLVITGKGKDRDEAGPIPVRRGILKHQVPLWLQTPPLSHVVLQTADAHLKHGGGGATYVYLRRKR